MSFINELKKRNIPRVARTDMDTLEMEVGIYQTSESETTAVVNDFSIKSEKIGLSGFE